MATLYSDQEAKRVAQGSQYSDGFNETDGNQSISRWTRTTVAADAQNDTVYVLQLPKGSVLIDGEIVHGALGVNVTLSAGSIGLTTGTAAAAAYLAATASATAGIKSLFATRALGRLTQLTEDTTLTLTIGGADVDAGIYLDGWVRFIQN
jgi:hypothetical protein